MKKVVFIAYISFLYEFIDDHQIHLSSVPFNNELQININTMEKCIEKKGNFFLTLNLLINNKKKQN